MPTPTEQAEELEALIRRTMFEHAAIKPRGFDSIKARARIHRMLDDMFDEHALLTLEALVS